MNVAFNALIHGLLAVPRLAEVLGQRDRVNCALIRPHIDNCAKSSSDFVDERYIVVLDQSHSHIELLRKFLQ